ncbi:unnamed protein product [Soboliphyme baturini]|uniref:glutaminase n=1 Tax=Soboliphyme baturini TaxID=241478 RepID=A0A3P8BY94_9BILA|nr:unnamed protein product [Soboliphyme baturini]
MTNDVILQVADYIPQLARCDPKKWGVAICTIDGQRAVWGDYNTHWSLQSISKAFTYGIALDILGDKTVHSFVGQEPSGRLFNDISLNSNNQPHNPMINAGSIVVLSLLKPDLYLSDRFEFIMDMFRKISGSGTIGFSNSTYLSERATADRNFALAYFMREHKCFPKNVNLNELLDFYFQVCSIETTCESAAVMAATLANGGVCPVTGEVTLKNQSVRDVLSLMYSCGMYDYSGQFAFRVGLPAKSAVSGGMILVIPNVMGIAMYSPPLDHTGNTVRGVNFSKVISPFFLQGVKMNIRNYDDRTPLHVAASEGKAEVVEFLIKYCKVELEPRDRWKHTPLDNARQFDHEACVKLLEISLEEKTAALQNSVAKLPGLTGSD